MEPITVKLVGGPGDGELLEIAQAPARTLTYDDHPYTAVYANSEQRVVVYASAGTPAPGPERPDPE